MHMAIASAFTLIDNELAPHFTKGGAGRAGTT